MILALDRQGKLYEIDDYTMEVVSVFLDRSVCKSTQKGWRKRLVGTSAGQLYLVVKLNRDAKKITEGTNKQLFKVYELSDSSKVRNWVEVEGFGDRVLFVFRDYCFFVAAIEFPGCQLRNCMVYCDDSFPQYSKTRWVFPDQDEGGEESVAVFRLGGQGGSNFQPASLYPGFPVSLWTPPSWVLQPNTSQRELEEVQARIQSDTQVGSSYNEEEDEEPAVSNNQDGASNHEEEDVAAMQLDLNTQFSEPHHEEAEVEATMQYDPNNQGAFFHEEVNPPPTMNGVGHGIGEASQPDTKEETIYSVSRAYITSSSKSTSTVQFKGFGIRSSLVDTLERIWSKHGNVVENSIIRNGDMLARALESMATVVCILEDSSARSLTNSKADYLIATLSDLQHMHLKVDWLVPFVTKALDLHQSKPLVDSLKGLGHAKVKTQEMRSKLVNDLAKVDEMEREVKARVEAMRSKFIHELAKVEEVENELEKDMAVLSETIPFSGEVDLDELLGAGLK